MNESQGVRTAAGAGFERQVAGGVEAVLIDWMQEQQEEHGGATFTEREEGALRRLCMRVAAFQWFTVGTTMATHGASASEGDAALWLLTGTAGYMAQDPRVFASVAEAADEEEAKLATGAPDALGPSGHLALRALLAQAEQFRADAKANPPPLHFDSLWPSSLEG